MTSSATLNALRAFEVAARTGSFTNAARELGVTSAAVSQQVKLLEDHWQEKLFIRQGNRIALTDAGQTAYPQLAEAMVSLDTLSNTMQRREKGRTRLILSAPQSVAETWLAPRLAAGSLPIEHTAVSVRVDDDPIDFVRDRIDMRIFYGHDLYGDYRVETLFHDCLIAVASPSFIARQGLSVSRLDDHQLIHTDWGPGFSSSPNWARAMLGKRLVDADAGLLVQSSSVALAFARQGSGVALAPSAMAEEDIAANRLTRMELDPIDMPHAYLLAYPKRLARDPLIRSVAEALIR